jgi:tRNA dimethylallyltransferase
MDTPHHLLDVVEPDSVYSAGDYGREARRALDAVSLCNRVPLVVGGTGFYLKSLLDGLPELPAREPDLRERLTRREQSRPGTLHRILKRLDPAAATRIHAQDTQKLVRAMEVRILTRSGLPDPGTGSPLSGYRVLEIGLAPDREKLVEAIARRTRCMFDQGLVEEVRGLLAGGLTGQEKPFEALGYKQVLAHLHGQISLDEAISSTEIETRQYAKRQMTWFRRDPRVHWIQGFGSEEAVFQEVAARVREFLREFLKAVD